MGTCSAEVDMSAPSYSSGRCTVPALALIAGPLVFTATACGSSTTTSQTDPGVAPQDSIAVSGVTSREVRKRPFEPIDALLQGRTAGVDARVNPDGSISVRIRGAQSFNARTSPLYVVDGIPYETGADGALRGINPNDIESIEVLKDPPETSIYGVRGANGVILIKTKRP